MNSLSGQTYLLQVPSILCDIANREGKPFCCLVLVDEVQALKLKIHTLTDNFGAQAISMQ